MNLKWLSIVCNYEDFESVSNIPAIKTSSFTTIPTAFSGIDMCAITLKRFATLHLIRALSLSYLSNNTKRWLSAYLKERTASCRYNFTLSPSFHARARVRVPQGACLSPTLFIILVSTFPQSDDFLTRSSASIPTSRRCMSRLALPRSKERGRP